MSALDHLLNNDLAAILTVIAAMTTAIVSVIKSIRTGRIVSRDIKPTLDKIYTNTNGEKNRLLAEISRRDITIQLQLRRIEQLESKLGNRRVTDSSESSSYKE